MTFVKIKLMKVIECQTQIDTEREDMRVSFSSISESKSQVKFLTKSSVLIMKLSSNSGVMSMYVAVKLGGGSC